MLRHRAPFFLVMKPFGSRTRLNVQLHGPFRSYCVSVELHLLKTVAAWFNEDREALLREVLDLLGTHVDVLLNKESLSSAPEASAQAGGRKRKRDLPQELKGEHLQLQWETRETRPVGHVLLYSKNGRSSSGSSSSSSSSGGGGGGGGAGGGGKDIRITSPGFTHLVSLPVTLLVWPAPLDSDEPEERRITSFFGTKG